MGQRGKTQGVWCVSLYVQCKRLVERGGKEGGAIAFIRVKVKAVDREAGR